MPARGRPPQPGTAEEKAAIRREKVRLYVKAHRERKRGAVTSQVQVLTPPNSRTSKSPPSSDSGKGNVPSEDDSSEDSAFEDGVPERHDQEDLSSRQASSGMVVVSQSTHISNAFHLHASASPAPNKALTIALLGAFRSQFLPRSVRVPKSELTGSELVTPCSAWITTAYAIATRQDSGALRSCMVAIGLCMTAMQENNEQLRMASLDVYRRALRQVRNDIKPLAAGGATNYLTPYLSCLATAMFEIMHDGFSGNTMQHVKGAISLMRLLPRDKNVNTLMEDMLMEDLCMWEIVYALKYRYPSPLRPIRRNKGPRKYSVIGEGGVASKNATICGDLLDCADEISTVMAQVDQLQALSPSKIRTEGLYKEVDRLDRIDDGFDAWSARFHGRFAPIYVLATQQDQSGVPALQFASYEIAAAWVYYLTFRLCAFETNIEVHTELLQQPHTHSTTFRSSIHATTSDIASEMTTTPPSPPEHQASLTIAGSVNLVQAKQNDLRAKLRCYTTDLVDAISCFIPIPKGIVGQSLVLFPMDRAKAMLKRETARLNSDLASLEAHEFDKILNLSQSLDQLVATHKVFESLQQTFGLPPMPEDLF